MRVRGNVEIQIKLKIVIFVYELKYTRNKYYEWREELAMLQ